LAALLPPEATNPGSSHTSVIPCFKPRFVRSGLVDTVFVGFGFVGCLVLAKCLTFLLGR